MNETILLLTILFILYILFFLRLLDKDSKWWEKLQQERITHLEKCFDHAVKVALEQSDTIVKLEGIIKGRRSR